MGDDGKRISAKAASIEDIWGSVSTIKAADMQKGRRTLLFCFTRDFKKVDELFYTEKGNIP